MSSDIDISFLQCRDSDSIEYALDCITKIHNEKKIDLERNIKDLKRLIQTNNFEWRGKQRKAYVDHDELNSLQLQLMEFENELRYENAVFLRCNNLLTECLKENKNGL